MVEEIQGGVPITEELNPNTREYFPTFSEWVIMNGVRIAKSQTGASGTLYTVPDGHILYVDSVYLNYATFNQNNNGVAVRLKMGNLGYIFELVSGSGVTGDLSSGTLAQNIPNFLKIEEKESIDYSKLATCLQGAGGFTGFLVKKPVS